MILAAILTGLVTALVLVLALFIIYRVASARFFEFCSAPDDKTPSPLAAIVQSIASVFASALSQSLKAVFMGVESVESKNRGRLQADFIADSNPMLGAILSSFPAVAKRIAKQPALAQLAIDLIAKHGAKNGGGGGGGGLNESVKFNL